MAGAAILTFGELLSRYRGASGLTQAELAERAGLSQKGISDLERGARQNPRRETVRLLAEALGLDERSRAALEDAARRRRARVPGAATAPDGLTWTGRTADGRAPAALPLVGRRRELGALDETLAGAGPPLLLFAGEPGIGKSRLLQEAMVRAPGRGWTVLAGGCHRRSGQEPFAPLLGAFERHLARTAPAERRAALRGCGWLVRLLPELADEVAAPAPTGALPPEQERRLMFAAAARYLAHCAGPAGTLLVLDDLQWTAADALDLLGSLVLGASEPPVRVVAAYRDTDVRARDPLAVMVADLARDGVAERLNLAPLDEADAGALLDEVLGPGACPEVDRDALRTQVVHRTGGIPFFVVSCAQAMQAGALDVGQGAAGAAQIPWTAAETIRQRVAALPREAQELIGVAAVAGRTVPRGLLLATAARAGLDERTALVGIEATCRARLLVEAGEADYQFPHDLIREVVGTDLGMGRRTLLHRLIARALEEGPGDPPAEVLAFHYGRGGDDDKAITYLERSADHAFAMHANAQAASGYADAVARLAAAARTVDAARVRERLAGVLILMGQYDEALAALDLAADTYRERADAEGLRRSAAQIGWIHVLQGRPAEGLARLLPQIASTPHDPPTSGLASAFVTLAALYFGAGRFREQLEAAERAVELARAIGDDQTWLRAKARLGQALHLRLRLDESLRVAAHEVIPLAESAGDLSTLWRACDAACTVLAARGELQSLLATVARAKVAVDRLGDPAAIALFEGWLGDHAFWTGEWQRARERYERFLSGLSVFRISRYLAYPPCRLGCLSLAQGDWEAASRHLAEAARLAEQASEVEVLRGVHYALAERDLVQGRHRQALARLAPLFDPIDYEDRLMVEGLPLLAWALLESGQATQAEAILPRAVATTTGAGMRPALADALRIRAELAIRRGDWEAATAALDRALSLAHAMAYPYLEAKALCVRGRLDAARGEPGGARAHYTAALAILHRLGERLYAEGAERALLSATAGDQGAG